MMKETGIFEAGINKKAWEYFIYQKGLEWNKATRLYDSTYNLVSEALYKLNLGDDVVFNDITTVQTEGKTLANQVELFINNVSYGKTNRMKITGTYPDITSIGFANAQNGDDLGEATSNLMDGWNARHVISYVHNSAGQNSVRCQTTCWTGTEDQIQEVVWMVR